jgi:hypothetical protein
MLRSRKSLVLLTALAMMFVTTVPGVSAQELPPGGTFVDDDGNPHESSIEAHWSPPESPRDARLTATARRIRSPAARWRASSSARSKGLSPATRDWFPDDTGSVHEADINIIAENGIAFGYTDGTFGPLDSVTRGQMASFLVRALDDLAPATKDWFPDDAGSPHEADINVIAENGISIGYTDGTFRPNTPINRAEMATLLVRALGLAPIQPPPRTVEVAAYFLMDSLGGDPLGPGPFLVPVARRISTPKFREPRR